MKTEFEVGEVFQCGLIKLKCVDNPDKRNSNPCVKCYFANMDCGDAREVTGDCESTMRVDGENVIFVKSED